MDNRAGLIKWILLFALAAWWPHPGTSGPIRVGATAAWAAEEGDAEAAPAAPGAKLTDDGEKSGDEAGPEAVDPGPGGDAPGGKTDGASVEGEKPPGDKGDPAADGVTPPGDEDNPAVEGEKPPGDKGDPAADGAKPPEDEDAAATGEAQPLSGEAQAAAAAKKKKKKVRDIFIKGDLIYPGTRRLLSRYDHVGVSLGANIIQSDVYAVVSPGMAWYSDFGLAVSAHVPLRLLAVDLQGKAVSFGGMKIRRQDWDEISDYARIIRFITYGRKEANIYASINTMRPTTIGHGMLMYNYQGDIDVDRSLTGLVFDAYNDYLGCQLQVNDITFQSQVMGGLAFIKPLSLFLDDNYSKSFSLGVEYIMDTKAPRCVRYSADSSACVPGTGHMAGYDPYTGMTLDDSFVRTDPDTGRFAVEEAMVQAIGGSAEFKFYKSKDVDLKVYGTYHQFLNTGGGAGAAGGVLARINAGRKWISAFRLRGEYRTYEDGFLPNYFNTLYEIQKYSYLPQARDYQVAPTKYQQVFGDPKNGFIRQDHGRRHGYNVDLNWGLFKNKRSDKQLALGVGLQDSTGPNDTNFYAHIEFPMLGWLQVFGTYMLTDMERVSDLFKDNKSAIILTGLRLQILPILFINAHYSQSFRTIASPGVELHIGNDTIVDAFGNPSALFAQDSLYENVHTIYAELEFGWEFDDE